ncbi:unnamed protein product [Pleuronectes platessa]|uniref:Uncharacterized protein n=1 Tax=Pleuronectes platessa TaxID=8262 RepID=A0A9N7U205_PLEPL|nr:unnamed protein product [Pleuronectes platessa]
MAGQVRGSDCISLLTPQWKKITKLLIPTRPSSIVNKDICMTSALIGQHPAAVIRRGPWVPRCQATVVTV